ncbi:sulfite oxidase [Actinocorallia longicatena]|uniref:Sulfite oxidase n=2 Tax=Actinocorallia longicatena TaxID=111803 RepID=A0ABP6QA03_9ACTN
MRAAVGGLLAAGVALGVAETVAALIGPRPGPMIAVGSAMVDRTPEALKQFAIRQFGDKDKLVLVGGIAVGVVLLSLLLGLLARRRWPLAAAGMGAFGLLAAAAAVTRPGAGPLDALPALIGITAGIFTLRLLCVPREPAPEGPAVGGGAGRRRFLALSAGAAGVAVAGGGIGRLLASRRNVEDARAALRLPAPARPARPLPAGVDMKMPGLTPFVTSNKDFYRVDTALVLPQVDPADWTLRISGLVDRPIELTFDDLLRRPLLEYDATMTCVSNEVGGPYVSSTRWLGASLADLLREAGVRSGADQLLSRSADGWTAGTPIEAILDGREALLAVGMDGEPLPIAHGFPARMVVPGLYGYGSATKWVVDMKVTRFTDSKAYWVARGYAERSTIKTLARIDLPRPLQKLPAGPVVVAGVAWAQRRGISAVEVRVDDGPWRRARLAAVPNTDTWRQWSLEWAATPGVHRIETRATDGSGATQQQRREPPLPDGATGWHSVVVTIT